VLAVLQARGGSVGVPRKNLRPLCGHPLVAYSIASALAAERVSRLIVSTDDEEIADVCRQYGAEVPFLRPAQLAQSDMPDLPLFEHALEWLDRNEGYRPDVIVQLRPTSPLRPRGLIDEAVALLTDDPDADCVRSITLARQNPYKMWRPGTGAYLSPLMQGEFAEPYNMPRQQLPPVVWQTGHLDVVRRRTIVEQHSLTGRHVLPINVSAEYCLDIDSETDLSLAEWTLSRAAVTIDQPRHLGAETSRRRAWPAQVRLLALDFDGVLTDNRVYVSEDGVESVACHRGDGMGIAKLRSAGIDVIVLSTETNPVVAARCRKLDVRCLQGIADKASALRAAAADRRVPLSDVIFVGNDANDVECMRVAGFSAAPADAHRSAAVEADLLLRARGGCGAVREICDRILARQGAMHGPNG
jgi:N-acylneuraminate cytidylyltransferase